MSRRVIGLKHDVGCRSGRGLLNFVVVQPAGVARWLMIVALSSGASHARGAAEAEPTAGEAEPTAGEAASALAEHKPAREYFIGGGLTSMATPPVGDADFISGINVVLYYGGRHLAGVAQFIVGGSFADELKVAYGGYSLGARYRFFDFAVTPFVGLGIAASSTNFNSAGHQSDGGLGLAPYAELGGEVFRHSTVRFMVTLRVDQPFYESLRDINRRNDAAGRPVYDTVATPFIPISLNVSVGWGFGSRDPT